MPSVWEPNMERVLALADVELAYIAGFFDGEGCVCLYKNGDRKKPTCKVSVSQKRPAVLHWLHEVFNGSLIIRQQKTPVGDVDTHAYEWALNGHDGPLFFLKRIRKYLRIKADEVDVAIDVLSRLATITVDEFNEKVVEMRGFNNRIRTHAVVND